MVYAPASALPPGQQHPISHMAPPPPRPAISDAPTCAAANGLAETGLPGPGAGTSSTPRPIRVPGSAFSVPMSPFLLHEPAPSPGRACPWAPSALQALPVTRRSVGNGLARARSSMDRVSSLHDWAGEAPNGGPWGVLRQPSLQDWVARQGSFDQVLDSALSDMRWLPLRNSSSPGRPPRARRSSSGRLQRGLPERAPSQGSLMSCSLAGSLSSEDCATPTWASSRVAGPAFAAGGSPPAPQHSPCCSPQSPTATQIVVPMAMSPPPSKRTRSSDLLDKSPPASPTMKAPGSARRSKSPRTSWGPAGPGFDATTTTYWLPEYSSGMTTLWNGHAPQTAATGST